MDENKNISLSEGIPAYLRLTIKAQTKISSETICFNIH